MLVYFGVGTLAEQIQVHVAQRGLEAVRILQFPGITALKDKPESVFKRPGFLQEPDFEKAPRVDPDQGQGLPVQQNEGLLGIGMESPKGNPPLVGLLKRVDP
jgi:hypothetical protein